MDSSLPHLLSEGHDGPATKKARSLTSWEASLMSGGGSHGTALGLAELFGGKRRTRNSNIPNQVPPGNRTNQISQTVSRPQPGAQQSFMGPPTTDDFFTLRMEHREGGVMARHRGEERILLFRSDRAGAIAKIIFSSNPAAMTKANGNNSASSTKRDEEVPSEESELVQMSQAKIHVLDVKEQYRGRDLGGLLFSEAVAALRHRYEDTGTIDCDTHEGSETHSLELCSSVRCQLDAEEDVRRHNKLVGFYEQLGCRVKPKAKVQYLNNNDGETYRKIPMEIALRSHAKCEGRRRTVQSFSDGSLVGRRGFLPVKLLEAQGARVGIPGRRTTHDTTRRVDWLVVDDGEGGIQFRTTQGHCLLADPDGRCTAVVVSDDEDDEEPELPHSKQSSDWSNFRLYRVSDNDDQFSSEDSDSDDEARRKELWMLRSSHGTFLRTDPVSHTLLCSKGPAFWQANNDDLCLTCTSDTPPRRQHYRKSWVKQTVQYVTAMRDRYLRFGLKKLRLRDALDIVKALPCDPFRVDRNRSRAGTSLRTLCFRTAEAARNAGHPDWVQFVALVHELGGVVSLIDMATASESQDDFNWTITCRSRVVGCSAPRRASFSEFRHLNADEANDRFTSAQGMYDMHCGLSEVLLSWTGPEYMYHMLQHNSVGIPEEGLVMVRLFPLGDWHTHGEYETLANDDDEGFRNFVSDFDELRRDTRRECKDMLEMTDEECDKLWNEHYCELVSKYSADGELQW